MFGWDEHRDEYDQVYNQDNQDHQAKFSHEVLAGAASFAAMKKWEDDKRRDGEPVDHQFAKEAIAALAGAEVDKLAETKGLDYVDRERAKHEARRRVDNSYDNYYNNGQDQWNPDHQSPFTNYQDNNVQDNTYITNNYQDNNYQDNNYQDNNYNNNNYDNNNYNNNNYNNNNW